MEIEKIHISTYTPQLHKSLLSFLTSQYENRSSEYLDWWLSNLDKGGADVWSTTFIAYYDNRIVACCTSNPFMLKIGDQVCPMFYESNTIVSPEVRGCGIGKILYSEIIKHKNRITIGLTKSAYVIQTQKLNGNYPILNVRVYVSANWYSLRSIINKFLNRTHNIVFPKKIKVAGCSFTIVENAKDLSGFPEDGIWLNDNVELIRSKEWLISRFIDIYRKDYSIYTIHKNEQLAGYAVFRKGRIYGVEFISIVDFRCKDTGLERVVTKAANRIAKINKIGFTFCMSSRLHSLIRFLPLTIRLPKKIKNVTVVDKIKDENILFTSADSNLDFVYYE